MRKISILLLVLGLLAAGGGVASASPIMLFDRGLPTTNLNNGAGSNRSNVQWSFTADPSMPDDYWLVGDDFTIGAAGSFFVDTLRLWSTSTTGLSLWFGESGGPVSQLAGAPTVTGVTYDGGAGYQGNSGNFGPIYQLDFALGQVLDGTTTYQFFLDGPMVAYPSGAPPYTSVIDAYVHSSNAALSGSTQQGADNLLLYAEILNGTLVDRGTWDSDGYGWDKSSDGNVQAFGSEVPEPSSLILLGTGLLGLVQLGRRKLATKRA